MAKSKIPRLRYKLIAHDFALQAQHGANGLHLQTSRISRQSPFGQTPWLDQASMSSYPVLLLVWTHKPLECSIGESRLDAGM